MNKNQSVIKMLKGNSEGYRRRAQVMELRNNALADMVIQLKARARKRYNLLRSAMQALQLLASDLERDATEPGKNERDIVRIAGEAFDDRMLIFESLGDKLDLKPYTDEFPNEAVVAERMVARAKRNRAKKAKAQQVASRKVRSWTLKNVPRGKWVKKRKR